MTSGVLLDSHSLLWFGTGAALKPNALLHIARAASSRRLFVSHISIWEMGVALGKKRIEARPDLGGLAPGPWFNRAAGLIGAQVLSLSEDIVAEAALVPAVANYGDPGDCFLIATARIRDLSLVTRDGRIIDVAERNPDYLSIIVC